MQILIKVASNAKNQKYRNRLGIQKLDELYGLEVPHGLTITNLRILKKKIHWLRMAGASVPLDEIKNPLRAVAKAIRSVR